MYGHTLSLHDALPISHSGADLLDDTGELMPEQGGQRHAEIAFRHVQIGMAQARRLDLDQHLAPSGPVDLDALDLECSGDPVEYRSLHGASPLIGDWKIGRAQV